ncbi:MAG TPA: glycoside hydrolase family 2 TIM barrel-domain containing protein [Paludibacteraceae bacterium]|nr:glycoside hydrolase family 2 TIM barrel-domain containing protein [Paludibacteraceae bacterium]
MNFKIKCAIYLCMFCASDLIAKETIPFNANWKFTKETIEGAESINFNDDLWENIQLPHTWNNLDGQDGENNYYRGTTWYRKFFTVSSSHKEETVYLKINASNTASKVYINGQLVGSHIGGYAAFMFDITNKIIFGANNLVAIQVDNSEKIICPPLSADFTFHGGITRGVELIFAPPVHINPNEYISNNYTKGIWVAQPGVIIKQNNVSKKSAELNITTKLKNNSKDSAQTEIELMIKDSRGRIVKSITGSKDIAAKDTTSLVINTVFENPHLWNGVNDPYLYQVEINLKVNGDIVDTSIQPLGFRYFYVDPNKGFFLNGESYPLRGICMHEDYINKGKALSDKDRKETIDLLRETGCNYFRLSHYQHGDFTYNYLDSLGIICWTEVPVVNTVGINSEDNEEFKKHAVSQMYELLRQQYNHPCVVFWGLSNEVKNRPTIEPVSTLMLLNSVVKSEDTYRYTTIAVTPSELETNGIPDVYSHNRYDGWYYNSIEDFGKNMDQLHLNHPTRIIGVSEYGVGANPQHHQCPVVRPKHNGPFHPEEYQNLFHEQYLKMINERPYLWSTSVWIGVDFSSDSRNEGGKPGINDKGLVTYDRKIKKDAFYWYKANWNKRDPFVYITSRRDINRETQIIPVKIYSNCDTVILKVNGKILDSKQANDHIFLWEEVFLKKGKNKIEAIGIKDNSEFYDQTIWNYK